MSKRSKLRKILVEHFDLLKDANYEKCMDAIIKWSKLCGQGFECAGGPDCDGDHK